MKNLLLLMMLLYIPVIAFPQDKYLESTPEGSRLTDKGATFLASLSLKGICTEYPNKPSNMLENESHVLSPKQLTPTFYGCYDWHSSVHGHWMLIKLLKEFPDMKDADKIKDMISRNITKDNMEKELAYFNAPRNKVFERTYGWAWYLKLTEELYTWDDPWAKELHSYLKPLADVFVSRYKEFLPKQSYPIRTGTHNNSAFGIIFALDYAATIGDEDFKNILRSNAVRYYAKDVNSPLMYEPSGADFLSPTLVEAELMSKVLSEDEFKSWCSKFVDFTSDEAVHILNLAHVSDRSDLQIVHLDGLNLSKGWALQHIANKLGKNDPNFKLLQDSAANLLSTTLPHIASGDYAGEHWLASFAVYALTKH